MQLLCTFHSKIPEADSCKGIHHRCFLMTFAKYWIQQNTCGRLIIRALVVKPNVLATKQTRIDFL